MGDTDSRRMLLMPPARPMILIPAAGASRRMEGRDKLLEEVGGEPILRRAVRLAKGTGCEVLVALPAAGSFAAGRLKAIADLAVGVMPIADADEGMSASLRAGAAAADGHALMILLPDMPEIDAADLAQMLAAFEPIPDQVLRATTEDGVPGHPVIFPQCLVGNLRALQGDQGARAVISGRDVQLFPLPGRHAVTDLDTPQDWKAWRAGHAPQGDA